MQPIPVSVVGASGYSGEELIRLLVAHPMVEITRVTSRQWAGQPVGNLFPRFADLDLGFSLPDPEAIARDAEVAFLALPHGLAAEYAVPLLAAGLRVIDISADFRLRDPDVYSRTYGREHPAPQHLGKAVYGLPECYREQLRDAQLVACPGCYPTSVILPSRPLLAAGMTASHRVEAISMSGVTGAGRKVDLPYIFPECNESVRPYSVVGHRHVPEMEQELTLAAGGEPVTVTFVPHLVPINRGIHSTILLDAPEDADAAAIGSVLEDAYAAEPFVRLLPPGRLADTKHVTWTNVCEIGYALDRRTGRVILSSAIDNLTKGASGQAVQCMNLACGLPETTGLL